MSLVEPKGEVRTQGTHLYFVDRPAVGPAVLVKFVCPTGLGNPVGGVADDIEDTCLDEEEEHTFVAGLSAPADIVVPFNLVTRNFAHQRLFDLKATHEELDWVALLSESADDPTLSAAPAEAIVPPDTRTSISFRGYVRDVTVEIGANEIVRGSFTIRRRGAPTVQWYTPAV